MADEFTGWSEAEPVTTRRFSPAESGYGATFGGPDSLMARYFAICICDIPESITNQQVIAALDRGVLAPYSRPFLTWGELLRARLTMTGYGLKWGK